MARTLFIRPKADLIYGASGTRKTSNIGLAAMYIRQLNGKRTRLITCDPGGYDVLLPLVELGIIEPWVISTTWPNTIDTLDLACQGSWPVDVTDPSKGLTRPDPKIWEQIGLVAFEGLTSIGDTIHRRLRDNKARLSQDPSYTYIDADFGKQTSLLSTGHAGSNMSYFGFIQDKLYELVCKSHLLPCDKVLWTALEGKGEEEGTRIPVFGPSIAGKKAIGKAPQWFGNCLHIEMVVTEKGEDSITKQIQLETKPIMFLRPHADRLSRIPFPAKTRDTFIPGYGDKVPETMDPPDIAKVWAMQEELRKRVEADIRDGKVK